MGAASLPVAMYFPSLLNAMIFTGPVQERRSVHYVFFTGKAISVHLSVYLLRGSLFFIDMLITTERYIIYHNIC